MTAISCAASKKIAVLSLVFSAAVVVAHCSWRADSLAGKMAIVLAQGTLARMAVPFFFVISGFFLARHIEESGWWLREIGKRVRTLVVPYVIWTVVLAITLWIETREIMGLGGFGPNLCKMPALAPLWYVRCLMLFILTLPILKAALNRGRGVFVACLYISLLGLMFMTRRFGWTDADGWGGFLTYGYSLEGLFFFTAGVYLQRHFKSSVSRKTHAYLLLAGIMAAIVKLVLYRRGSLTWVNLNVVITPLLLAGLWGLARPVTLPRVLEGCAFPIFLLHGVVLSVLRNAGGTYQPCNPWLELTLGVAVPIVIYRIIRRYAYRLSDILFGGR